MDWHSVLHVWLSAGIVHWLSSSESFLNPLMLLFFVVAGVAVFFFTKKGGDRFSIKAALRYLFPREVYGHNSSKLDFMTFAINSTIFQPGLALLATLVITGNQIFDLLVNKVGPVAPITPTWLLVTVQAVAVWIVKDFLLFFQHYCLHKVPVMWAVHRGHHSAEVMHPITTLRQHPLEWALLVVTGAIIGIFAGGIAYLTGAKLTAAAIACLAIVHLVENFHVVFRHSHVWISYGKILDQHIISPSLHQIHHSLLPRHRDKNIGQILTLWDRLFGTLYVPKHREEFRYGISADEIGENNPHPTLAKFYFEPLQEMVRVARGRRPEIVAARVDAETKTEGYAGANS